MNEAAEQARVGTVLLQRYRIDAVLGRGGMSTVYRGVQLSVKRPVAIKLIAGNLARDQDFVQRFRREAEAMARLQHPNTVRIYEFGVTEQDELFIVMELLEGRDLSELLHDEGGLSLRNALSITRQTLESLCEAHASGIVHRDLKPANIFLSRLARGQMHAKVMDFGIADIDQHGEHTKITRTGVMIGTPAYMSPEQALGDKVDARSDLYSLGIILFEMWVGRTPFEGQATAAMLLAHLSTPPQRLAEACPNRPYPDELQTFLDRLLAKRPQERPTSAEEALALLETIPANEPMAPTLIAGSVIDERAISPLPVAKAAAPATSWYPLLRDTQRKALQLWAAVRERKPVLLALVACLLVITGSLALRASRHHAAAAIGADTAARGARAVRIESEPRGASVRMDGVELGVTPYDLRLHGITELSLVLAGFEPAKLVVGNDSGPTIHVQLQAAVTTAPPAAPVAEHAPVRATKSAAAAKSVAHAKPTAATHSNVAAAKRAYQERKLDEGSYRNLVRNLKAQRNERLEAAKRAYRKGGMPRAEYDRRVHAIEAEYTGR